MIYLYYAILTEADVHKQNANELKLARVYDKPCIASMSSIKVEQGKLLLNKENLSILSREFLPLRNTFSLTSSLSDRFPVSRV